MTDFSKMNNGNSITTGPQAQAVAVIAPGALAEWHGPEWATALAHVPKMGDGMEVPGELNFPEGGSDQLDAWLAAKNNRALTATLTATHIEIPLQHLEERAQSELEKIWRIAENFDIDDAAVKNICHRAMVLMALSGVAYDAEIIRIRVARAIANGRGQHGNNNPLELEELDAALDEHREKKGPMVPYFASDDPDGIARYVQRLSGVSFDAVAGQFYSPDGRKLSTTMVDILIRKILSTVEIEDQWKKDYVRMGRPRQVDKNLVGEIIGCLRTFVRTRGPEHGNALALTLSDGPAFGDVLAIAAGAWTTNDDIRAVCNLEWCKRANIKDDKQLFMLLKQWGGSAIERKQRRTGGVRIWGHTGVRLVQK
jgi:hypothetical protein